MIYLLLDWLQHEKYKNLFLYLFFISIFLELCHLFIPQRSFEYKDLFGNVFGVLIVFLSFNFIIFLKKRIMIKFIKIIFLKLSLLFLIFGCSSIPQNTSDSCKIFDERYLWYKHSKKVEQKWGTPIHIQLAIIKMESDFDWLGKTSKTKTI